MNDIEEEYQTGIKKISDYQNKPSTFWKGYAIFLTVIVIIFSISLIILIADGKLTPEVKSENDIKNNITNNYEFNPSMDAPISNDFDNVYEINFNIDEKFIESVCGNSS